MTPTKTPKRGPGRPRNRRSGPSRSAPAARAPHARTARAADAASELHDHALALVRRHVELLEEQTAHARTYDPELAEQAAGLARSIATLTAEVRKRERHDRQVVAAMSPAERDALVLEYLAELTPERRAVVRAHLDALDAGGRGLLGG